MRKFIINVNGNSYEVEVEEIKEGKVKVKKENIEVKEQTPKAHDISTTPKAEISEVKKVVAVSHGQEIIVAPMPGNVWNIDVEEGQEVKEGDVLLILEAMKMENEILAPRDGVVAQILATTGASVGSGDQLIILD